MRIDVLTEIQNSVWDRGAYCAYCEHKTTEYDGETYLTDCTVDALHCPGVTNSLESAHEAAFNIEKLSKIIDEYDLYDSVISILHSEMKHNPNIRAKVGDLIAVKGDLI